MSVQVLARLRCDVCKKVHIDIDTDNPKTTRQLAGKAGWQTRLLRNAGNGKAALEDCCPPCADKVPRETGDIFIGDLHR